MSLCKLANGLVVGYDAAGSGTPLVLLHAFPLDRSMWEPQVAALADVARVITLDMPGFGESSAAPFTIESVADCVNDFLTAMNIPHAILGGLSMGGYVALTFARKYANKLRGLILADTRAGVDDTTAKANRDKAIELVNAQGSAALFDSMLPRVLSAHTHATKADTVTQLKSIAAKQPATSVGAALVALRDRPDANPVLKSITVPTLVIVGEEDSVTPPLSAANLAGQIRGCSLVHIPAAGHLSNAENPEVFNAAVRDYLARLA